MKKITLSTLLVLCLSFVLGAEKWSEKPFLEWSKKEALKVLKDSSWTKTQAIRLLSSPQVAPRRDQPSEGSGTTGVTLPEFGGTRDFQGVEYSISFLSALPVRQALARLSQLNGNLDRDQALAFVRQEIFENQIVVAVGAESAGIDFREFFGVSSEELQDSCYLELKKSGRKIYLKYYLNPRQSGNGQPLFVFPRSEDGRELVQKNEKTVTFVAPISKELKLEKSFRLGKMVYRGNLEL